MTNCDWKDTPAQVVNLREEEEHRGHIVCHCHQRKGTNSCKLSDAILSPGIVFLSACFSLYLKLPSWKRLSLLFAKPIYIQSLFLIQITLKIFNGYCTLWQFRSREGEQQKAGNPIQILVFSLKRASKQRQVNQRSI